MIILRTSTEKFASTRAFLMIYSCFRRTYTHTARRDGCTCHIFIRFIIYIMHLWQPTPWPNRSRVGGASTWGATPPWHTLVPANMEKIVEFEPTTRKPCHRESVGCTHLSSSAKKMILPLAVMNGGHLSEGGGKARKAVSRRDVDRCASASMDTKTQLLHCQICFQDFPRNFEVVIHSADFT